MSAGPLPSAQAGPDALVEERVGGTTVRCYASRPHSLVGVLDSALPVHGDAVLLVDPALGREVTYGGFAALVEGAAAALRPRPGAG
jgi:hypothetical protein